MPAVNQQGIKIMEGKIPNPESEEKFMQEIGALIDELREKRKEEAIIIDALGKAQSDVDRISRTIGAMDLKTAELPSLQALLVELTEKGEEAAKIKDTFSKFQSDLGRIVEAIDIKRAQLPSFDLRRK